MSGSAQEPEPSFASQSILQVLVIGQSSAAEFAAAHASLAAFDPPPAQSPHPVAACLALEAGGPIPDLIVLVQSRPGEIDASMLARLRKAAPGAGIVGLLGSWCEGETRSGRPLPGLVRVYAHQWPRRFAAALRQLAEGGCPLWGLPPTATPEDREFVLAAQHWPELDGPLGIDAPNKAMRTWLADLCRAAGAAAVELRRPLGSLGGLKAAIVDCDPRPPQGAAEVAAVIEAVRPAPVVALAGFPRAEDIARLKAAGAAAVLSKPLAAEDLVETLARLLR